MEKRFRALRTVGTFYKVLGIIAAIITVLIALSICGIGLSSGALLNRLPRDTPNAGFISLLSSGAFGLVAAIVALIYGSIIALSLYAAGEGIYLLLALEENTRLTTLLLQQQQQSYQPLPQAPQPVQPYRAGP